MKEREQTKTAYTGTDEVSAKEKHIVRTAEAVCMMLILASLFLFGVLFFVLPKKSFSENENRNLARFPAWKLQELTGGVYTGKVEDYISDHFPARDTFMALATEAERLSGKKLINGVYLAKGRLIDRYDTPQYTDRAVSSFVRFANALPEDITVKLMLIPTAASAYGEDLPLLAPLADRGTRDRQQAVIKEICDACIEQTAGRIVPVYTLQESYGWYQSRNAESNLFFTTDHHWNLKGAYQGYLSWQSLRPQTRPGAAAAQDPYGGEGTHVRTVSVSFRGTTWSKLNDPYFAPDVIDAYVDPAWDISVTYTDTGVARDTPYNEEWLSRKDQYSYFLDGIHPLVIIENHAAPEGLGAIAIVKDSYANIMIPFMIRDFETIYVFDPRYYREGISDFIKEHPEIKEVLILYNLGTMDTDAGIGGIF